MNEEHSHSTPEECIDRLNTIETGIKELVATINSGQFADVRLRITQLQTAAAGFKAEVQRLPDIQKTTRDQDKYLGYLSRKIQQKDTGIEQATGEFKKFVGSYSNKSTVNQNNHD
uniref:Biogenesis of lysosome-related organelles complex 1 subunit 7 n=1 Tax=Panagrolaimus sp. PS1159 TaxID=55785 RepID=A0AC35GDY3_9BILA